RQLADAGSPRESGQPGVIEESGDADREDQATHERPGIWFHSWKRRSGDFLPPQLPRRDRVRVPCRRSGRGFRGGAVSEGTSGRKGPPRKGLGGSDAWEG